MNFIDIGGFIAVLLGYIVVAIGFHMEATQADKARFQPVGGFWMIIPTLFWPAILLVRIGQFVANPSPQRRP